MYVVMVSSECAPVAKVGGLADVVFGLSGELMKQEHTVEIILPKYDCMRYDHIYDLKKSYEHLMVPWFNYEIPCTVWFGFVHGRRCFFIEPHSSDEFFNRGSFYGMLDEHMRFAFFCKAALEFMYKSGKRPDIIHTHDWQTALLPVLLYELYQNLGMVHQRVVHTIHNFKHQGIVGENVLWFTGLGRPEYYFQPERIQDDFNPSAINLTKAAVTYSNFVTTVSPQHAIEVTETEQGYGLGHTLHRYQDKFGGVLNGLDYEMWDPQNDTLIAANYSAETIDNKFINKKALRDRLLLRETYKPIIAYVGRLDSQKGVHLIQHTLFWALENGAQFVLLGSSPEHGINDYFWHLKNLFNENPDCHLELAFDEELAHLIYAGADMFIVPSMFEPCGLTQMISLRYGTVPIVRSVGGLVDIVFDRDFSHKPMEQRNGFVFYDADFSGIESALLRAVGLWNHYPEAFKELMIQGMNYDYSWKHPAQDYINIYNYVRHK